MPGRFAFAAERSWQQRPTRSTSASTRLPDADRVVATLHDVYREFDPDLPEASAVDLFGAMASRRAARGGWPPAGSQVSGYAAGIATRPRMKW